MFPDRYWVCRFSRIFAPKSGTVINVFHQANERLVRLCSAAEWTAAREQGAILPDPADGFVHLSRIDQVHLPATRLYRGRRDLVLLHLDAASLDAPVRWEPGVPTDPEAMLFPHLYGPLPVQSVLRVVPYPPGEDGAFAALPSQVDRTRRCN